MLALILLVSVLAVWFTFLAINAKSPTERVELTIAAGFIWLTVAYSLFLFFDAGNTIHSAVCGAAIPILAVRPSRFTMRAIDRLGMLLDGIPGGSVRSVNVATRTVSFNVSAVDVWTLMAAWIGSSFFGAVNTKKDGSVRNWNASTRIGRVGTPTEYYLAGGKVSYNMAAKGHASVVDVTGLNAAIEGAKVTGFSPVCPYRALNLNTVSKITARGWTFLFPVDASESK